MTADRRTPTAGPLSHADFAADVNEEVGSLNNRSICLLTGVTGTGNSIAATCTPTLDGYVAGQTYHLIPIQNNTGSVSLDIDGRGVKAVKDAQGADLTPDALIEGYLYQLAYDGAAFRVIAGSSSLAAETLARIARDAELQAQIDAILISTGSLDAVLLQLRIEDRDLSAPPGSPPAGGVYIVGPSATGAWSGHETELAVKISGTWTFYVPAVGYSGWLKDEEKLLVYDDGGWTEITSGNLPSVAVAMALNIPLGVSLIHVAGYWSSDERAPMTFRRSTDVPTAELYFQSADLAGYWEYVPEADGRINARCAGLRYTGAASQKATSTSSVAVGSGSKSFTTQSGKDFRVGDHIRVVRAGMPTHTVTFTTVGSMNDELGYDDGTIARNISGPDADGVGFYTKSGASGTGSWVAGWKPRFMTGVVTAYSGTSLTMTVDAVNTNFSGAVTAGYYGSGTYDDWTIEIDDTQRWQALLLAHPNGGVYVLNGISKCGPLDANHVNAYDNHNFQIHGIIEVPEQSYFEIAELMNVEGLGGGYLNQFEGVPVGLFRGATTSPYVVSMTSGAEKELKRMTIEDPYGVGLYLNGADIATARQTIERCSCHGRSANVRSIPFLAESAQWTHMKKCVWTTAQASAHDASMDLRNSLGVTGLNDANTGLWDVEDVLLVGKGVVYRQQEDGRGGAFQWRDILTESFPAGVDTFTFDLKRGSVVGWYVNRVENADAVGGDTYLFNVKGAGATAGTSYLRAVRVDQSNVETTKTVRPTSAPIYDLATHAYMQDFNAAVISSPFPFSYPHERWSSHHLGFGYQGRWLSQRGGPLMVPRAPLNVLQDPSTWGSISLTSGLSVVAVRDPFGGMMAGRIDGAVNGSAQVFASTVSVALGDWFLVGCFLRQPTAGKLRTLPNFALTGSGYKIRDITGELGSTPVGNRHPYLYVDGPDWRWVLVAYKVSAVGGGATGIVMSLNRNLSTDPTEFAFPGAIQLPTSESWSDGEVIALAHQIGPWRSSASAADFAMPLGVRLKTGKMNLAGIPTSASGLATGDVWSNSGVLTIV